MSEVVSKQAFEKLSQVLPEDGVDKMVVQAVQVT